MNNVIQTWHSVLKSGNENELESILDDEVIFHSPVVHSPQTGKALTMMYLLSAAKVLGNDSFHYQKEVIAGNTAVLEFVTDVDGILINGVDIITWNQDNKITEFKVMVRPLKAINKIHQHMAQQLALFTGKTA